MTDFAKWESKAIKQVFPGTKHGKCFFHLKSNVKKKYPKQFSKLEQYIDNLGNCHTIFQLNSLWELVKDDIKSVEELKNISSDFITYFEDTYFNENEKTFHIGFLPPGFGNTNNMLESHHRYLKRDVFEYKVRSLGNILFISFL